MTCFVLSNRNHELGWQWPKRKQIITHWSLFDTQIWRRHDETQGHASCKTLRDERSHNAPSDRSRSHGRQAFIGAHESKELWLAEPGSTYWLVTRAEAIILRRDGVLSPVAVLQAGAQRTFKALLVLYGTSPLETWIGSIGFEQAADSYNTPDCMGPITATRQQTTPSMEKQRRIEHERP